MLKIKDKNYLVLGELFKRKIFWREFFYFLSALLLVFIILEIIWPNIILAYFNLNYLLLIYIITALFLLIVSEQ